MFNNLENSAMRQVRGEYMLELKANDSDALGAMCFVGTLQCLCEQPAFPDARWCLYQKMHMGSKAQIFTLLDYVLIYATLGIAL
jgi:hypothetical protein